MKKLIVLIALAMPFVAYSQSRTVMPYKATYSSDFKLTDKYVAKVLNAWKTFEDNKLDMNDPLIADTINAQMSDGSKITGKQNFFNAVKQIRSLMTDLKVNMVAYMGVKSLDKNDDIVLIWVNNTFTKDGQKISQDLHQVWSFDKAGQVSFFRDYTGNGMGATTTVPK